MKPIYLSDTADVPPSPPENGVEGYPTNGSLSESKLPTAVGAWWYYSMSEEFKNLIKAGGLEPSNDNLHQMADVLTTMRDQVANRAVELVGDTFVSRTSAESTYLKKTEADSNFLSYTKSQALSEDQKTATRQKIGAAKDGDLLHMTAQTLTDQQQEQVQTNIGLPKFIENYLADILEELILENGGTLPEEEE